VRLLAIVKNLYQDARCNDKDQLYINFYRQLAQAPRIRKTSQVMATTGIQTLKKELSERIVSHNRSVQAV